MAELFDAAQATCPVRSPGALIPGPPNVAGTSLCFPHDIARDDIPFPTAITAGPERFSVGAVVSWSAMDDEPRPDVYANAYSQAVENAPTGGLPRVGDSG
ncbi:hypothetical protein ACKUVQ_22935 [Mycobacterium seoulense]|uniref:hypothetical protein n=1 Tax=Mycobacterium seoulense TaxID=386911 RepID=UPI003CF31642